MRLVFISCFLAILLVTKGYGQTVQPVPVASEGRTVVEETIQKTKVRIVIRTHTLEIGKPSDTKINKISSSCTYSKYPCSLVDGIDIVVGGNSIPVPRSAFCDLADLSNATINEVKKSFVLSLEGGDASESYVVKIEFDSKHVINRKMYDGESKELLQETTYHQVVID